MEIKKPSQSFSQKVKTFSPLVLVLFCIVFVDYFILLTTNYSGIMDAMRIFMGLFFLTFGSFKLLDLKGFVMNYQEYDILAKRSKSYAQLYPFIELGLGTLYLTNLFPLQTNIIALAIMLIGSVGVINTVWIKRKKIHCACLGAVIKLPMTTITIIEDLGMAAMAAWMISNLI